MCQTKKTTTPTRSSIGKGSKESRIDITPWQLWQINLLNMSGWTNHNKNFFYFAPLCWNQIYLKNEKKYEEERLECVWGKRPEAFKSNHFLSQNLKKKQSFWWSTDPQELSWNILLSILPGRAMQSRLLIALGEVGGLCIPGNLSSHWFRGICGRFL